MEERIVYIKIPIILKTSALTVKQDVFNLFGQNIFVETDYREDLSANDIGMVLLDQIRLLSKLGYVHKANMM